MLKCYVSIMLLLLYISYLSLYYVSHQNVIDTKILNLTYLKFLNKMFQKKIVFDYMD